MVRWREILPEPPGAVGNHPVDATGTPTPYAGGSQIVAPTFRTPSAEPISFLFGNPPDRMDRALAYVSHEGEIWCIEPWREKEFV